MPLPFLLSFFVLALDTLGVGFVQFFHGLFQRGSFFTRKLELFGNDGVAEAAGLSSAIVEDTLALGTEAWFRGNRGTFPLTWPVGCIGLGRHT